MDIKTLKIAEYRGHRIYVRNFNTTFEYLVFIKGELYTTHVVIHPAPFRQFTKDKYTQKQLTDVTKYLLNVAEATVDHVLSSNKKGAKTKK